MSENPSDGAALSATAESLNRIARELLDGLDAMVAYWDADRVCRFANAAYLDWFGRSPQDMLGITLPELLGPLYALNLPYIDAAYCGQKQVFERDIRLPEGAVRHSLATYTPRVVDGRVSGIFVHVADVGPLKNLERELRVAKERAERLATHDPLTGLANRSLLLARLHEALSLARRKRRRIAVIAIDVDEFKLINDLHGHAAGDRFLTQLARNLTRVVRASDLVARMGGDEFVVLWPEVEALSELESLGQRLLGIARHQESRPGVPAAATLSLGIALYPDDCDTVEELLAASDRALYRAKRAGKNQIGFSSP